MDEAFIGHVRLWGGLMVDWFAEVVCLGIAYSTCAHAAQGGGGNE
jgi:hypothetical protein